MRPAVRPKKKGGGITDANMGRLTGSSPTLEAKGKIIVNERQSNPRQHKTGVLQKETVCSFKLGTAQRLNQTNRDKEENGVDAGSGD